MQIVFPSTEAFFAADERRRRSGEMDFGVWWRDGTFNVTYRVSAVRDTGEIYAIAMRSGPGVHEGDIELLAQGLPVDDDYAEAERILDGWVEICGQADSLQWVRNQLASHRPKVTA